MVDLALSAVVFARVWPVQVVLFDFAPDVPEQAALAVAQVESARVSGEQEVFALVE